jgi:hypothetical protein
MIDVARFERKFREVDDLVLHLKGLVLVRALLKERGASEEELDEHGAEIARVRSQLARLVQKSGGGMPERAAA